MERSKENSFNGNTLNGRSAALLEEKPVAVETLKETTLPAVETVEPEKVVAVPEDKHPVPEKPRKKRGMGLILGVLGVGAIAAAGNFGYQYWQFASTHQETDDASVAANIHPVNPKINGTVEEVEVNDNQLVQKGQLLVKLDPTDLQNKVQQSQASLEAARRQAAAAEANIALAAQTAQAKTTQAQGDIAGAEAAISTAQAAVREAQAGIPAAQAAVREAEAGIPAAQAQVAQANASLLRAQTDYNRYASLLERGAIARQQVDAARAEFEVARAQKDAALQGVEQAKARVAKAKEGVATAGAKLAQAQEGVANAQARLAASKGGLQQATASGQQTEVNRSQYEAAKAAIAQSEASLKDAQQQLSYINITAPSTGRIGRKSVQSGQRVQAGTPLMVIVDNYYWVVANFKETQLEKMKPGQEVEIKLDAFPHHEFKGKVDSFSPASGSQFALLPPDNATGNFTKVVQRIPVKVVFDSESIKGYESQIAPGMSATVNVAIK